MIFFFKEPLTVSHLTQQEWEPSLWPPFPRHISCSMTVRQQTSRFLDRLWRYHSACDPSPSHTGPVLHHSVDSIVLTSSHCAPKLHPTPHKKKSQYRAAGCSGSIRKTEVIQLTLLFSFLLWLISNYLSFRNWRGQVWIRKHTGG